MDALGINPATNRIATEGFSYDASGNLTRMPNPTGYENLEYDSENRLVKATHSNNQDVYEQYAYGLDNRRLWRRVQQGEGSGNRTEQVYFYGAFGELLDGGRIYFGGRLIGRGEQGVVTDRLGSVDGPAKYYPYGQERTPTPQETEKFATYHRDSTGLDYAMNRYYTSAWGRFLTADPYLAPRALTDPQGWNRYAYVENDPVNYYDPAGLYRIIIDVNLLVVRYYDPWEVLEMEWRFWSSAYGGTSGPLIAAPAGRDGGGGGGGSSDRIAAAERALEKVRGKIHAAAALQEIFTGEQLDCIAGIETGRTWNAGIVAKNGRVGLFQFDEANWRASGTSIPWNGGEAAKDPEMAAQVALALLFRKLGYSGVGNPTDEAIQRAIDNFGESDDKYGQAVMDCAKELKSGNFTGAYNVLVSYANWVAAGRP